MFTAVKIFDKFLANIGHWTFKRKQACILATVSILMGAKMEEPISPSFNRMISLLDEEEQQLVSKKALINMEERILQTLGFDLIFPGPIPSMERLLRLMDCNSEQMIYDLGF